MLPPGFASAKSPAARRPSPLLSGTAGCGAEHGTRCVRLGRRTAASSTHCRAQRVGAVEAQRRWRRESADEGAAPAGLDGRDEADQDLVGRADPADPHEQALRGVELDQRRVWVS